MVLKLSLSSVVSAIVTMALFYLMQALIQGAGSAMTDNTISYLVEFVRIPKERHLIIEDLTPETPPLPEEAPPVVRPQLVPGSVDSIPLGNFEVDADVALKNGGGFVMSDGDYLPIVKVQPQYPRRALSRGMTGWAIVEFTVTAMGNVIEASVVGNCGWIKNASQEGECGGSPNGVFDSAAIKAVLKFKYKPKVVDGVPIVTGGVQNKITFDLTND
jgi:protein TonB